MIEANLITEEEQAAIKEKANHSIEEALVYAETSPAPDVSTIMEGVYAD